VVRRPVPGDRLRGLEPVPPTATPTATERPTTTPPTDTPTPPPTPTDVPTPTATPVPPTETPTPEPTSTPSGASPTEITVDNLAASKTGAWTASTFNAGYYGADYEHDGNAGKGTKTARFTPVLSAGGTYTVRLRYSGDSTRASNVPVAIYHNGALESVVLNQRINGNSWFAVGDYTFTGDGTEYVELSNAATNGYVVIDAVRWEPVP
jgi:hypothetical protein